MSEAVLTPRHAWQPLTPRGVAAFAPATFARLFLAQFAAAALVALAVVWFLHAEWFPVVRAAIGKLPADSLIQGGTLRWPAATPAPLAENRLLSLVVDAADAGETGRSADVTVVLHKNYFKICSLAGCWRVAYPPAWRVGLNRPELEPWWGAWHWPVLAVVALLVMVALLAGWCLLATIYFPFAKLAGFFADRELTWAGSWRLAGAALLPGAFLNIAGLFFYSIHALDLIHLGLIYLLHIVCGWVFIAASPFFLPKESALAAASPNPFVPAPQSETKPEQKLENPFGSSGPPGGDN